MVAYLITQGINIPLNDRLDRAGDPARIADLAETRRNFEDRWVTWNIIRTLVHTAAFTCLAWALVVYTPARSSAAAPAADERPPAPAATAPR
ncbi:anthrone oxygenase family protein [Actinomadura madurae]|uniref:anthrone oxygenase family protein n=1 Tax=Actinomadura madurae TaxID=1993 RepID=UPI0020D1FECB|nr:DUF1772 domain-containing protein [Actinomadura madurae]MCP9969421.1 DUF1772 domain-containing protein [Actinomadura madurae]MCP9981882.1 DUF1772 domain-containing protein [Actinomadura madurae]MCQ0006594.1 DUF1772 domain-containing protein [Actinomadura madurae]